MSVSLPVDGNYHPEEYDSNRPFKCLISSVDPHALYNTLGICINYKTLPKKTITKNTVGCLVTRFPDTSSNPVLSSSGRNFDHGINTSVGLNDMCGKRLKTLCLDPVKPGASDWILRCP